MAKDWCGVQESLQAAEVSLDQNMGGYNQKRSRMKDALPAPSSRINSFDVTKLILSCMIVYLHIMPECPAKQMLLPLFRCAVPLFFMISSYLFFVRYLTKKSEHDKTVQWNRFLNRNLRLYLFWFVVWFVPMVTYRQWFAEGVGNGLLYIVHSFFFGSTFIASWFLIGHIISMRLVIVLSNRISSRLLLLVASLVFVLTTIQSSYSAVPFLQGFATGITGIFPSMYNSFWAGIFWNTLGFLFASYVVRQSSLRAHEVTSSVRRKSDPNIVLLLGESSRRTLWILGLIGLGLLYGEQAMLINQGWFGVNDSLFCLSFVCVPVFCLLLTSTCTWKLPMWMLGSSLITYCVHDNLNVTLQQLGLVGVLPPALGTAYATVILVVCWIISLVYFLLKQQYEAVVSHGRMQAK